jgi:TolA-binding protein
MTRMRLTSAPFALLALIGAAALAPHGASAQVLGSVPLAVQPDPAVTRMQERVDALEEELRRATGRLEQLGFELAQARRAADQANEARMRLETRFAEIDARLRALEPVGGDVAPAEAGGSGPAAPAAVDPLATRAVVEALPQDEAGLLKESRRLLLAGDYPSAEQAFGQFLTRFPESADAPEAQFLLGESLLIQEAYPQAIEAFGALLTRHPARPVWCG